MAYDLLFKKQIPVNFSAHPSAEPSLNPQTSLTLVTLAAESRGNLGVASFWACALSYITRESSI